MQIITTTPEALADLIDGAVRTAVRDELAKLDAPDLDALLDVREAAALVGTTPNGLRVATSRGEYTTVHHGRRVRWRKRDLLGQWQ